MFQHYLIILYTTKALMLWNWSQYFYNMKNPAAIIKYTATNCAPSNQFDSPSFATLFAINTETIRATSSNWLKISTVVDARF